MLVEWRIRERSRFEEGIYTRLPWNGEPWWIDSDESRDHYAHVSTADPSKLAFTASPEHGAADRQTRMKPGKYLRRFFADKLPDTEIALWAGKFAGENEVNELRFASSPEDIETVYQHGPSSCMDGDHEFECEGNPTRVYGAGDLAIAYFGTLERVTARAVCWPDKKVRSRIYGDSARLAPLLEAAGYSDDCGSGFNGARLLKIEHEYDVYIVPYMDGEYSALIEPNCIRIASSGDFDLDGQYGISVTGFRCECCGDRESGDQYSVDDETWCSFCHENLASMCERCEELTHDNNIVRVGDRIYCTSCVDEYTFSCARCGEREGDDSANSVDEERWCESCYENYSNYCERCCENTSSPVFDVSSRSTYGETWCDSCRVNYATECESCCEFHPSDDMTELCSGIYCEGCEPGARADLVEEHCELRPGSTNMLPARAASSRPAQRLAPAHMGRRIALLPIRAASSRPAHRRRLSRAA